MIDSKVVERSTIGSEVKRFSIGDRVKLYKLDTESNFDMNKTKIRVGRIVEWHFKMLNSPRLEEISTELFLDINFGKEVLTDIPASIVRDVKDPYFSISEHVCIANPVGIDKFSKFGTVVKRTIDPTISNALPLYDVRTIDGNLHTDVNEADLTRLDSSVWLDAYTEWGKRVITPPIHLNEPDRLNRIYVNPPHLNYDSESKIWLVPSDDLKSVFPSNARMNMMSNLMDLYATKRKESNMPTARDMPSSVVQTMEIEKKEKKHVYVPVQYRVKRIIYNDPATIVFWEDDTKTIVKRGENEKFNKYTAFCAALAKKIYGNNSQVNRIANSGEDQTLKKSKKCAKDIDKQILHLRYAQHMSIANISEKLDISKEKVSEIIKADKASKKGE